MGPVLHRLFQEAGLPASNMRSEMLLGNAVQEIANQPCKLGIVRGLAERHRVPLEALGDLDTFPARVQAEIAASIWAPGARSANGLT
jgi:hypothetical protein